MSHLSSLPRKLGSLSRLLAFRVSVTRENQNFMTRQPQLSVNIQEAGKVYQILEVSSQPATSIV